MKALHIIAIAVAVIGALNWLLVGVFAFDLVAFIFGANSVMSRIIYTLVGVAGVWLIFSEFIYRPFLKSSGAN